MKLRWFPHEAAHRGIRETVEIISGVMSPAVELYAKVTAITVSVIYCLPNHFINKG